MKNFNKLLIVGFAAIAAIACSDDKNNILQEAASNLVKEITLDVNGGEIVLADAGDMTTVKVTAKPTDAEDIGYYEFRSGDTKVFTVDNKGVITATGQGSALLSVVAKNNASVTAKCNVLVVGTRITSIEISNTYKDYTVTRTNAAGPSFNLLQQITILPSDANTKLLKYTSSNPEVATVTENGVVTAVWKGQTEIKAEATDKSGVFAVCKLTVNITPVTSIAVGANVQKIRLNTLFNDDNENLVYTVTKGTANAARITVLPTTATLNILDYISSAPAVIAVAANASNNLEITPKTGGTANVTINSTDGSNLSAQAQVEVYSILDRSRWTIKESTPSGSVTESNGDVWGGPIENVIRDDDAAGLIKAGAPGGPAAGSDVYFVVDLGEAKAFNYMIVSGTWSGGINTGVKINRLTLYGSNDGTTFTALGPDRTISTSTYNTMMWLDGLNTSNLYRYVKVVVTSTSYGYSANGNANQKVTHYVIRNFRLGIGAQQ
ncbi:MAG: Ig-like domain-containing protein [Prevotella sp.]|jgi:uncharacterized protein YjdB|nr:Ig-like domain-containing protein [Prevotella sp.]